MAYAEPLTSASFGNVGVVNMNPGSFSIDQLTDCRPVLSRCNINARFGGLHPLVDVFRSYDNLNDNGLGVRNEGLGQVTSGQIYTNSQSTTTAVWKAGQVNGSGRLSVGADTRGNEVRGSIRLR